MIDDSIIVVPCYNEAARLDVAAFSAFLERSCRTLFIMVDDGSRDETGAVLEQLRAMHPARVAVLRLAENVGKAEAVRRGVKLALRRNPAYVGYWDADLATPLESIESFHAVISTQPELLLVMGSRVGLLGRHIQRTWKRHYIGRVFATAASLVLGLPVYDTQCGAKLFRVAPATASLFDRPFCSRWVFDVEILARLLRSSGSTNVQAAANTIYEYPLERWQDVAGSRLKWRDFLIAAMDLAAIRWHYSKQHATTSAARQVPEPAIPEQTAPRRAA
jgi:glycosyltransferase involved in cell wall biosynthesis